MPANKAIDRAGALLRDSWRNDTDPDQRERQDAVGLVSDFRAGFQYPLVKVNNGLRAFVRSEGGPIVVSQRLKRITTIIDKLDRHEHMKLTRMQDIGGCRAILGSDTLVSGVLRRIRRNWDVRELYDYVSEPKSTGYRAIHVVVMRDDHRIEVQLRTGRQHAWAATVERLSGLEELTRLKDGVGPEALVGYYRVIGEIFALQEQGIAVDEGIVTRYQQLRAELQRTLPQTFPGG